MILGEIKLYNNDERRRQPRIETKWPITIFSGNGTINGVMLPVWLCCEYLIHLSRIKAVKNPYNSYNSGLDIIVL